MGRQIITNKYGLPETLVMACKHDTHRVGGDISVTQLIDGPQVRLLKRKHDYESDVSDNLYAMMGTALHHIIERANIQNERQKAFILTAETLILKAEEIDSSHPDKASQLKNAANFIFALLPVFFPEVAQNYIYEKTMRMDFGDLVLYGTFDLYDKRTGILYDYKFCAVYNWVYPEARDKWKQQLNIYALMLHNEGYPVNGIKVVAFFRDWSSFGSNSNKDYPDAQIKEINIPMGNPLTDTPWQDDVTVFVNHRIGLHRRAMNGENIECSGTERWSTGDSYAIKTPTAKKALAVLPNQKLALAYIQEHGHKHNGKMFAEYRPGESRKCASYCSVAQFCPQRKKELELINQKSK